MHCSVGKPLATGGSRFGGARQGDYRRKKNGDNSEYLTMQAVLELLKAYLSFIK
jgi:hypothetical protein